MIQPQVKIKKKKREVKKEKVITAFIYGILIFAIVALFFTAKFIFFSKEANTQLTSQSTMHVPTMTKMSMTTYDRKLARQMMDKNNDGKCDACGMPVEICMDSGQLQCDMDSESTIGILGSQHIHADFKVYLNSQAVDFSDYAHMERMQQGLPVSSFIHVDSGAPAPEKTGDVLHMHATGVPLWIFFGSIGLELPSGMKAYVNGEEISDYQNYVFNDLNKILITDGNGDLQKQMDLITDFAKNH